MLTLVLTGRRLFFPSSSGFHPPSTDVCSDERDEKNGKSAESLSFRSVSYTLIERRMRWALTSDSRESRLKGRGEEKSAGSS